MSLFGKNIIIGVCGGIAAYKSAELVRLFRKAGAHTRVVMTKNAERFITPLTLQALSEQPVCTSLFDESGDASIRHIDWAREADAIVIAPATANMIAKIAAGIADDAMSTLLLAATCPIMVCPSMNTNMLANIAVQNNIQTLKKHGYFVMEPDSGELACGDTGAGRLPDPPDIFERTQYLLTKKDFSGIKILITAGPTREFFDPVRFISNPSSGKMGFAIAKAAEHRGADVVLVAGPVSLPDPQNVRVVRVESAQNMADAVFEQENEAHVIIKSAAVSDYSPGHFEEHKIKKQDTETVLSLQPNIDILKTLGQRKGNKILVGFAAETEKLPSYAQKKLAEKHLDMIVGNIVGPSSGFATDTNQVTFFHANGKKETLPNLPKFQVAHILLDRVADLILQGK